MTGVAHQWQNMLQTNLDRPGFQGKIYEGMGRLISGLINWCFACHTSKWSTISTQSYQAVSYLSSSSHIFNTTKKDPPPPVKKDRLFCAPFQTRRGVLKLHWKTKWHWSPHVQWTRQDHRVFWQCSASCRTCRCFCRGFGQTQRVNEIENGFKSDIYINTMYSICVYIYIKIDKRT